MIPMPPSYVPPARIVDALDAVGWRLVSIRPELSSIGTARWYATITRLDDAVSLSQTGDDPAALLDALAASAITDAGGVTAATITDEQIRDVQAFAMRAVNGQRDDHGLFRAAVHALQPPSNLTGPAREQCAIAWNRHLTQQRAARTPHMIDETAVDLGGERYLLRPAAELLTYPTPATLIRSVTTERVSRGAWIVVAATGEVVGAIVEGLEGWIAYRAAGEPRLFLGALEYGLRDAPSVAATWRAALELLVAGGAP